VSDQNNNAAGLLLQWWQTLRGKTKGILWGAILTAGAGFIFLWTPLGAGLVNNSYALPFQFRDVTRLYDQQPDSVFKVYLQKLGGWIGATNKLPDEAVAVYLDDKSNERLKQDYLKPWNRSYYAKLVKRCTADGAKAVVFDIVFSNPTETNADKEFADAMLENGNVVLASDFTFETYGVKGKVFGKYFTPTLDMFNAGPAAEIGASALFPEDGEYVRKYSPVVQDSKGEKKGSEAWAAARLINQSTFNESNSLYKSYFYMNFYAPESLMPAVSLFKAIDPDDPDVRPGFFKNKVVFVGEKLVTYRSAERKDEYSTPYSYRDEQKWYSGVGIHMVGFLNLIRGDYLRRLQGERSWIIGLGIFFGAIMVICRPMPALFIAMFSVIPIFAIGYYLFQTHYIWFAFLIPIVIEIPVALTWGVTYNSLAVYAEKVRVEQSLALYLSPKLVKKFARDPALLKPGATKHLLTILFTDIASFTSISEGMDPDELARLMNEYFQTAVHDCIHATDGTVVKYIGDAIFAFWNAPEDQDDHAYLACDAALRFRALKNLQVNGHELVTRIGLHTGVANVGNFGSDTRVDYTAIGENINLASRMEGLNKYTGTIVLITADTQREIGSRLITRYLGLFRLKGFEKSVGVYELVGRPEQDAESRALRDSFASALKKFVNRDFTQAEAEFQRTLEINSKDGPSKFYLDQIEELRAADLESDWKGEITLKDK
jgi:adenylate cyclase